MITAGAALLIAGLMLSAFEILRYRRAMVEELTTLSRIVGGNSAAALVFDDRSGAREVLSALSSDPAILSACLYRPDGQLFASYQREGKESTCPARPDELGARFREKGLVLVQPVQFEQHPIGTLQMVTHLRQLKAWIARYMMMLALVVAVAALVALLVSSRLERLISGPILELAQTAGSITGGRDYSLRAPMRTHDEVGVAVAAFNQMLDHIEAADHALREAEEASGGQARLLRSVLDSVGEGLIACDMGGHFFIWNPAATRLVGQGPGSIPPAEWPRYFGLFRADGTTLVEPSDLPVVRALRGEVVTDAEVYIRPSSAQAGRWVSVAAHPMRDERGRPSGIIAVVRDVTERRRAEEALRALNATLEQRVAERTAAAEERAAELKRSNEELESFAHVASHDLQEPLRAVASYTQLVVEQVKGKEDPELQTYVGHVLAGVERMRALIEAVLDYSRVGRRPLSLEPTDTAAVVDTAVADLGPMLRENQATVMVTGPLPTLPADAVQLGQVFRNLISNAVHFRSEAPPRVEIWAEHIGPEWRFAVRDNGVGIDPRYHERIFVIFQRLGARERPGTGIGLTICKKIVLRHGGRIWVESAPGRGSTFFFTIPGAREERAT
jgi:signal transduction histidine kinase/uncharacterized membrane protein affecting hemolysin expression